jgi:malonyl-CoA/methylmalonyl-CoA synthetase
MQVIKNAFKYLNNSAVHCKSRTFHYSDLLSHASKVSSYLDSLPKSSNIVYLSDQSYEFIPMQWGIWASGHISVPLCTSHPLSEWDYVLQDSKSPVILCQSSWVPKISSLSKSSKIPIIPFDDWTTGDPIPEDFQKKLSLLSQDLPAQMIYTSGTTGRPKGVLTTHKALASQVNSLTSAWNWKENDHILEILPLHHVHGNVNILTCALNSGASVTFHSKFDPVQVWSSILESKTSGLSLLMGVPTIYFKLIQDWKGRSKSEQEKLTEACSNLRLMVCGSMALPENTLKEWKEISGHVLLERYGMTECGMILSNPLDGERKPGFVGRPLPGVQVKVVQGELRVKSEGMFLEYFGKKQATLETFDEDGWFRTGDIVEQDSQGDFKILGRASVDILKVSGFKISALDIENDLLGIPDVLEVAVLGIPDEITGQKIGVIFKAKRNIGLDEIKEWSRTRMAHYKIPKISLQVSEIPRNQMGKVNKKELVKLFTSPN